MNMNERMNHFYPYTHNKCYCYYPLTSIILCNLESAEDHYVSDSVGLEALQNTLIHNFFWLFREY